MREPTNVEDPRSSERLTGFLGNRSSSKSIEDALVADLLRSKAFASKRAQKMPTEWGQQLHAPFQSLNRELSNPTVLTLSS